MVLEKKANAEPIPGYRLLELLGTGGFGEVWKCEAPGGIFKAIKFVYGNLNGLSSVSKRAENELNAVQHIKSIRHPFLLSIDRVECIQGELVIVTELADQNMHHLLQKHQADGSAGIPRQELLFFMREVAEVLDLLNVQCNLQHLDVKPRNLFMVGHHVKVADFGLVQSLSMNQASIQLGAITPLYAAPELFLGSLSRHCDQYSLAIVYQELLTGTLPFDGKNTRQLLMQHTKQEPNLSAIPVKDRPIVARALSKNPSQRFECCLDFVRALLAEGTPAPVRSEAEIILHPPEFQPGETQHPAGQVTERWRAHTTPNLPAGVLPGQRFLECLVNSPLVETWRTQTVNGNPQTVHFVYGCTLNDAQKLQELTSRLNSLQHPGLFPSEVVHAEPGRLVVAASVIKETLRDRFLELQKLKRPGITRTDLLDFIRAAAEILDYLYQQHSVMHLGLHPRNLVLEQGWLQLTEFGLAQLVWLPSGQDIAQRNARYAAPELFRKETNRASDQFSLALVFAEMLTGQHPFHDQDPRHRAEPDLEKLSHQDGDVISRALQPDPAQRWPSVTEMALALEGTHPEMQQQLLQSKDPFAELLKEAKPISGLPLTKTISEDLHQKIADLLTNLGGQAAIAAPEPAPILSEQDCVLEHRYQVCLPLGSARQHLERFLAEMDGKIIRQEEASYTLSMALPSTFWQRLRGQEGHVIVGIELCRVYAKSATPVEIMVRISTTNLEHAQSMEILEKNGPAILERLRKHVLVGSEKRMHDRVLWPNPFQVVPVYPDGQQDDPIDCRGKDISYTGMGLYLPHELDTNEVILQIPSIQHPPTLAIPATLVRAHRCADDWYDVGALFHLPALKKSLPDTCVVGQ